MHGVKTQEREREREFGNLGFEKSSTDCPAHVRESDSLAVVSRLKLRELSCCQWRQVCFVFFDNYNSRFIVPRWRLWLANHSLSSATVRTAMHAGHNRSVEGMQVFITAIARCRNCFFFVHKMVLKKSSCNTLDWRFPRQPTTRVILKYQPSRRLIISILPCW